MRAAILAAGLVVALSVAARGDVITRLPTNERVVALTFDACEQHRAMKLDTGIADFLVARRIPFTVFLSGRFVQDNEAAVKALSRLPFVELENHSWDHPNRMTRLPDDDVRDEILKADAEVLRVTGRGTAFFRFPAIRTDARTTAIAEGLGFRVVHYRWEAGDPDPHETADRIVRETLEAVRPRDILIQHINGRGWHSAEAMPRLIAGLQAAGYRFVLLRDYLTDKRSRTGDPRGAVTSRSHDGR
ncbi:MAG TPA: polysaccharide deacetylase family protein [Rhizomicrobium sp.]|jgi:peptidoglycan/xylan/chitin deacetylase (PgdA/CDA1 family)|nr:polysaccharide deacetylase family protein [Rhizomicrobium sp.]